MDKFVSQTETSLKKKKRRWTPKGRQVEDKYLDEVSKLFSGLIDLQGGSYLLLKIDN